jgi:hypothetical protein
MGFGYRASGFGKNPELAEARKPKPKARNYFFSGSFFC